MADLPEAFKSQMRARLGNAFDRFHQSLDLPPPVSVRYNSRKLQPSQGNAVPWCAGGRYLDARPSFTLDPLFHAGGYYVQEASSMLLEQAVRQSIDLHQPVIALDLCAAPGGKSTHLLNLLSDASLLVTNEVIRSRASILMENIEKWGCHHVIVTNNDPADFGRLPGFFDLILVDAPCSGEGLFRKDPAAMQQWSERNIDLCSLRQRRIVSDIWPALKPGGVLIYATCTYNEKENINNLAWLAGEQDLEFIKIKLHPEWGVEVIQKSGCTGYQCFPHAVNGEGFFFAAMRKSGNAPGKRSKAKSKLHFPSKAETDIAKEWIKDPEQNQFFLHGQQIRMMPQISEPAWSVVLDSLHILQAGTGVGEIMKNRIVPDHALALSVRRNSAAIPAVELGREQALQFLRKDNLDLPGLNLGFHVVTYEDQGLGWVNILANRLNNLYPASRRVRMNDQPIPE